MNYNIMYYKSQSYNILTTYNDDNIPTINQSVFLRPRAVDYPIDLFLINDQEVNEHCTNVWVIDYNLIVV